MVSVLAAISPESLVHRTKDGLPITMHRERDVVRDEPLRPGGITCRVTAALQDREVGWLVISWIPDFDARYADPDAFAAAFGRSADEQDRVRLRAFHAHPHVGAVFVAFHQQRRHIALALYREAARWLAEEWDRPLRAGDPNPMAERVWAKLVRLGEPVTHVSVMDGWPRPVLDYRRGR